MLVRGAETSPQLKTFGQSTVSGRQDYGETSRRVCSQTDAHLSSHATRKCTGCLGREEGALGERPQSCLGKNAMGVAVVKQSRDLTLAG